MNAPQKMRLKVTKKIHCIGKKEIFMKLYMDNKEIMRQKKYDNYCPKFESDF